MTGQPSYQVTKLCSGTVLDHIAPGRALEVMRMLRLEPETAVAIGMNFPSSKHGRKDIIKVDSLFLTPDKISILSLISPAATVSIIRDFKVTEKLQARVPEEIVDLLECPNSRCITNQEDGVGTRILVIDPDAAILSCHYCERSFGRDQLALR